MVGHTGTRRSWRGGHSSRRVVASFGSGHISATADASIAKLRSDARDAAGSSATTDIVRRRVCGDVER